MTSIAITDSVGAPLSVGSHITFNQQDLATMVLTPITGVVRATERFHGRLTRVIVIPDGGGPEQSIRNLHSVVIA